MKTETLLNSMVRDLWLDLQDPAIVWQLGTLAACLLVAWIVERRVLRWWWQAGRQASGKPSKVNVLRIARPS